MPSVQPPLCQAISYHAYGPGRKQIALSPNNNDVVIYDTAGKESMKDWKLTQTLSEHSEAVSAIDWCEKTNLIVTSAHDRNAYVWKLEGNEWKPTLVILRINRAATSVRWSPNGDKFAVTSGAKVVPVCHFEEANNWWISKMVKKHKSTVVQLAWCPNNKFIITGSTDFKCRIFSAYIEGVDSAEPDDLCEKFAKWDQFGECLFEFAQAKAWVSAVAWSPTMMTVAFAGHGSTMHFADLSGTTPEVTSIYHKELPYTNIAFVEAGTLVACGFDANPAVYKGSGTSWSLAGKLDPEKPEEKKKATSSRGAAFNKFNQSDKMAGKFGAKAKASGPTTIHKNIIVDMRLLAGGKISTSSIDGRVYIWDSKDVQK